MRLQDGMSITDDPMNHSGANIGTDKRQNEEDLMAEALVREIGRAGRWCAMVDAWHALLTVRRVGAAMKAEQDYLSCGSAGGAGFASSIGGGTSN